MKLKIEPVRQIKVDLSAIDDERLTALCFEEMQNTLVRLRDVVSKGRGADGQRIKPSGYSESYKQRIRDAKANFLERSTKKDGSPRKRPTAIKSGDPLENKLAQKDENTPNLFVTGDLLGSMQPKRITNGAEGVFNDQTQVLKASGLIENGYQGFFEFGRVDIDRTTQRFEQLLQRVAETIVKP